MSRRLTVVVDADALIAQTNPKDVHHKKAMQISQKLVEQNAQVLYPVTAIAEANAHVQRVLNSTSSAYGTAVVFTDPNMQVVEVNQETLKHAVDFFSPTTSKKNTLFDCIVAAVADEYKVDAVFSFDGFYKKKGFKSASEI